MRHWLAQAAYRSLQEQHVRRISISATNRPISRRDVVITLELATGGDEPASARTEIDHSHSERSNHEVGFRKGVITGVFKKGSAAGLWLKDWSDLESPECNPTAELSSQTQRTAESLRAKFDRTQPLPRSC